jgi:hypothetical protein
MKAYLISYDLLKPGQDYSDLIAAIEKISATHWHILKSAWVVATDLSAMEILNRLLPYLDANDKMIVNQLGRDAAWTGSLSNGSDWLRSVLPQ